MKKKKSSIGASDVILLGLCAAFFCGILFLFAPCGPKDDGSWMTCHWAGRAITGVAGALLAAAVLHLVIRQTDMKRGIDLAMILMALLAALTPGHLIGLCMMADMRCHRLMTPCTVVFAVLIIAASVVDFLVRTKREKL